MLSALNSQPTLRTTSLPAGKPAAAPAEAPQSPLDSLPDLSTIEARAEENAPAAESKEVKTGLSGTSKAVLAATGLATAAVSLFGAGSAQAQTRYRNGGYGPRGGYNHGYNHRHHRGGGNNAGAVIGGVILGAIIGGAIANQAPPPVYYPPTQPQYPQYPQQVQQPFYDNYGRLICPNSQGGWYVSTDHYQCRTW
ncbi:MAG: hypothetical protein KF760_09575 [Candidatus Eremiobacteraeota bacterium]|nr:hypothetical protein [Candidatus Eremiobacteraeota bacterium]MCW5866279.1 hypothetical protein [Candidatus Eremiobacteraeota bacterium]